MTTQNYYCEAIFRWFLFDSFKLYDAMEEPEHGPVLPSLLKRRVSRVIPIGDILCNNVIQTQESKPPNVSEIFHILFLNSKINYFCSHRNLFALNQDRIQSQYLNGNRIGYLNILNNVAKIESNGIQNCIILKIDFQGSPCMNKRRNWWIL